MVKKNISLVLVFALAVLSTTPAFAQGNEFKVRYNGGTIQTEVKSDSWDNLMTVSSDAITLRLKDGHTISINPKAVTGLSYGRNASRRIGSFAVAAAIVNPLFLFGMLKKNKQHFVGLEYETEDGKKGGFLLQAKNDKYRGLLAALKGVTGKEVETEAKEGK